MTLEEIMDRLGALGHEKVKMNKTNHLQNEVSRVKAEDFGRVLEVWEASVRATHDFVLETDIQFFKPIVRDVIPKMPALTCIRDHEHQVLGFLGASDGKVEMLFIHPDWRGQGIGKQLLESQMRVFRNKFLKKDFFSFLANKSSCICLSKIKLILYKKQHNQLITKFKT